MSFIIRGILSVSRACPKCGVIVSRTENQIVNCSTLGCDWFWGADPIGQVVNISAGIVGKAS